MPKDKPNLLVVWGDDIGWYSISAYNLGVMGLPDTEHRPLRA